MNLTIEDIILEKKAFIRENLLLDKKAVSALLFCSVRTVERMVNDGDLVVYSRYPGKTVRFRAVDVEVYIDSIKVVNNYD